MALSLPHQHIAQRVRIDFELLLVMLVDVFQDGLIQHGSAKPANSFRFKLHSESPQSEAHQARLRKRKPRIPIG
jgi:hypothetical protein